MWIRVGGKASSELGNLQSGIGVGVGFHICVLKNRGSGWIVSLCIEYVSRAMLKISSLM
jgi:hypothetical protein